MLMYEGQPKSSEHGVMARLLRVYAYIFFTQYQETIFVHHTVVSSKQYFTSEKFRGRPKQVYVIDTRTPSISDVFQLT